MPTLPLSVRRRVAACIASCLVLPVSILSVALFGVPIRGQSQLASAPATVMPATSLDSGVERDRINSTESWAEYQHAEVKRACYDKFLVTYCIDEARDVRRAELHPIHECELALDEAGRADRAARCNQERATREAQYNAERPQCKTAEQKNRPEFENKQEQQRPNEVWRQVQVLQRMVNTRIATKERADCDVKLKAIQEQGAANTAKRAESAKQLQERQQGVAERQKELEERREQTKRRSQ